MTKDTDTAARPEQTVPVHGGRYYCESCERRYGADAVECEVCAGEPLLDLQDPDVITMLRSFDARDFRKRSTLFTLISASVIMVPVLSVLWSYMGVVAVLFAVVLAMMAYSGLMRRFPPRKRLP